MMQRVLTTGLLLGALTSVAHAQTPPRQGDWWQQPPPQQQPGGWWQQPQTPQFGGPPCPPQAAPEINATTAGVALTLLAGSMIVVFGRRLEKKD